MTRLDINNFTGNTDPTKKFYFYVSGKEEKVIKADERGIWTWIKAKILYRDSYKLKNVLNAFESFKNEHLDDFNKVKDKVQKRIKIGEYNLRHQKNTNPKKNDYETSQIFFRIFPEARPQPPASMFQPPKLPPEVEAFFTPSSTSTTTGTTSEPAKQAGTTTTKPPATSSTSGSTAAPAKPAATSTIPPVSSTPAMRLTVASAQKQAKDKALQLFHKDIQEDKIDKDQFAQRFQNILSTYNLTEEEANALLEAEAKFDAAATKPVDIDKLIDALERDTKAKSIDKVEFAQRIFALAMMPATQAQKDRYGKLINLTDPLPPKRVDIDQAIADLKKDVKDLSQDVFAKRYWAIQKLPNKSDVQQKALIALLSERPQAAAPVPLTATTPVRQSIVKLVQDYRTLGAGQMSNAQYQKRYVEIMTQLGKTQDDLLAPEGRNAKGEKIDAVAKPQEFTEIFLLLAAAMGIEPELSGMSAGNLNAAIHGERQFIGCVVASDAQAHFSTVLYDNDKFFVMPEFSLGDLRNGTTERFVTQNRRELTRAQFDQEFGNREGYIITSNAKSAQSPKNFAAELPNINTCAFEASISLLSKMIP